jgi:hypothetical protein
MKPSTFALLIGLALIVTIGCGLLIAFGTGGPRVIVNLPKDQIALTPLPTDRTITGDRAVLWWTVFHASLDSKRCEGWEARDNANAAVAACYGKTH